MNILRRYIYIYIYIYIHTHTHTHTREELEWPIIAVTVNPRICGTIGSRTRLHVEKRGEKEFGK